MRKRADCGPSSVWPRLPFSSTPGVLTIQGPVPSFRIACCWTVSQVPPQGGMWLSVQTELKLNKFQYTLYKKARSIPHLTSFPPPKRKPLPSPLHPGTSVGGRGRRRNSLVPKWPAMSMHKAIMAARGTGMTPPDRQGRCEEGVLGGSSAPSEPSLSPPGVYSPESPLSS